VSRSLVLALAALGACACSGATIRSVDEAPLVTVLSPVDGSEFVPGDPVDFCATVSDGDSEDSLDCLPLEVDDPSALDHVNNDDPANWCVATTTYGLGDEGTPGAVNDAC
jgi:hypothetical protein